MTCVPFMGLRPLQPIVMSIRPPYKAPDELNDLVYKIFESI